MTLAALALMILAGFLVATVARSSRRTVRPLPLPRPPAPRQVRADVAHLLYCYRRPDGSRIYGGITNCPEVRHARHLIDPDDREWMIQTDGIMYPIHWLPSRLTARAAERALVREMHFAGEQPANIHHNPGRRRAIR
jgi:hypothetical protein